MNRKTLSPIRIFAAPALIAILSLFGLIIALVGDGPYDAAGWIGLGVPVGAVLWAWKARRV